MSKYTIFLEENLSENEIQKVLDAIFLLRGIKKIEKIEDDFSSDSSYNLKTEPSSPDFVSPQSQPFTAPTSIMPENITQEKTVQSNLESDISPDKAENQRRIISEALRWGINNKRITIEEIKDVSPQETVDIAQKIIKNMSDDERKKLLEF